MLKEHDRIVLTGDIPGEGLKAGDVGSIVHIHGSGEAFEIEFLTLDGSTVAIATVTSTQVRPVSNRDVTHARRMGLPV